MRGVIVMVAVGAGCAAELPPVPSDCAATSTMTSTYVAFDMQLRMLALIDDRAALPDDVLPRLQRVVTIVREGDLDGSGVGSDFEPIEDVDLTVSSYDSTLSLTEVAGAEVPGGYESHGAVIALIIVTAGDIAPAHVEEAAELVRVAEQPSHVLLFGLAAESSGTALAQLAAGIVAAGGDAQVASLDTLWEDPLIRLLVRRRARYLSAGSCLHSMHARLDDGRVPCTVFENLHPEAPWGCADLPARTADPTSDDPRRCRIRQVISLDGSAPVEDGWYYDDASRETIHRCGPRGARIVLTPGLELTEGSLIELHCVARAGICAL